MQGMTDREDPHVLSRRTTPTWEVELLISGVAIFAMLQLPGWLDDAMFALEPRLTDNWRTVTLLFYAYAKSAAIVLATTFVLHLLLRAQWIALVGMHSVYPHGVRLDRMRMGPIQREVEERIVDNAEEAIDRADNRASVVFAIGVTVAFILLLVCVFFCGALLLVMLLAQLMGLDADPLTIIAIVFACVMLPFSVTVLADRMVGSRLPNDSRLRRVLASMLGFYTCIGMGSRNNRVIATLTSNGGERRMMAIVVGSMVAASLSVMIGMGVIRGEMRFGSYAEFPEAAAPHIDPAHYDDQRNPARTAAVPYVQGMVIEDAYLKLVVPYNPQHDESAMRRRCPHARALPQPDRGAAQLACLAALRTVMMDGKPLHKLRYEVASDARTDRPALLAMIDVRELPRGRHELRIARPLSGKPKRGQGERHSEYDTIPFWR